jgi:hypothetical protein
MTGGFVFPRNASFVANLVRALGGSLALVLLVAFGPALAHSAEERPTRKGESSVGGFLGDNNANIESRTEFPQVEGQEPVVEGISATNEPQPRFKYEETCFQPVISLGVGCEDVDFMCDDGENGMWVQWYMAPPPPDAEVYEPYGAPRCLYSSLPEDAEPELPTVTLEDFRRLPIAAAQSNAQPSPHTLRGAETNFYAVSTEQVLPTNIDGFAVEVRATPVSYSWDYGDGVQIGPIAATGAALPNNRWGEQTATSHVYTETGDFQVTLTTHYSGEFSVDGRPWLPIPGEASVSSPPIAISVWRTVSNNYADDCIENPAGIGC